MMQISFSFSTSWFRIRSFSSSLSKISSSFFSHFSLSRDVSSPEDRNWPRSISISDSCSAHRFSRSKFFVSCADTELSFATTAASLSRRISSKSLRSSASVPSISWRSSSTSGAGPARSSRDSSTISRRSESAMAAWDSRTEAPPLSAAARNSSNSALHASSSLRAPNASSRNRPASSSADRTPDRARISAVSSSRISILSAPASWRDSFSRSSFIPASLSSRVDRSRDDSASASRSLSAADSIWAERAALVSACRFLIRDSAAAVSPCFLRRPSFSSARDKVPAMALCSSACSSAAVWSMSA
mmetsp:Transcript_43758/g.85877  ORF Transcript_43758/g.85877 Transcript_43758/m.85877 type:complete len:303 (+) Transcript_43758:389-1297(+)